MKSAVLIALQSDDSQLDPSILDSVVFYGVFGLLLFAPLAFGAVEPWSIFVLEAGSAGLLVIWLIRQMNIGELRIVSNPLLLPMLVFALLVLVQLVTGHTSYRYETESHGLLYIGYGLLCFLVIQCLRRTSQLRQLAYAFCGYGFAVAAFSLLQGIDPNGKLFWLKTPHSGGWIYGPYVNHNHYAGLMELLTPIPLTIACSHLVQGPRRTLAAVIAAVMASTIFLSGSRGGMLAFLVQMAILGAFMIRRRKGRKLALTLGVFLVLSGGLLGWLGGGALTTRLASIDTETRAELSGGTRTALNRDGLRMVKLRPLLGWGLGVFPTIYPQYRSFYTNLFVNEAHDDYIQLLVEMGLLGFVTMVWFLVVTYRKGIKKVGDWSKDPNGILALAALLGVTGILVHSFVDFNLQIPANAALFYVLCVLAAMDPCFRYYGRTRRRRPRPEMDDELSA